MRFDVKRRASYILTDESITAFKEKMLEYLENEMYEAEELKENEDFPYTIEDISNDVIREPLGSLIQDAFEDCEYYIGGVHFDDYFNSVWLDCGEDNVSDCVYEAVAIWRDEMGV